VAEQPEDPDSAAHVDLADSDLTFQLLGVSERHCTYGQDSYFCSWLGFEDSRHSRQQLLYNWKLAPPYDDQAALLSLLDSLPVTKTVEHKAKKRQAKKRKMPTAPASSPN
jgi:hypothetical protein